MKYAVLLAAIVFATSCRKHKCDPVPPTPETPTLVGTWSSGVPTHNIPTFTADELSWSGSKPDRYVASDDSIYIMYPNKTYHTAFGYEISKNNDSLTLYRLGAVNADEPVIRYARVK